MSFMKKKKDYSKWTKLSIKKIVQKQLLLSLLIFYLILFSLIGRLGN